MKKMMFVFPLAGSLLIGLNMAVAGGNSHKKVPGTVVETFNAMYPTSKEVVWEKKSGGFEADFVVNNKSMSLVYRKDGKLIDSKMEISASELPGNVMASLTGDYLKDNFKLLYVMKKDTKGVESYEMEVMKGALVYLVKYDKNGNATYKYTLTQWDVMNNPVCEGN